MSWTARITQAPDGELRLQFSEPLRHIDMDRATARHLAALLGVGGKAIDAAHVGRRRGQPMIFPKAETVTEITTLAERFRAAAAELDALATNAPTVELGTLRRQAYAVRVQVANVLTENEHANG